MSFREMEVKQKLLANRSKSGCLRGRKLGEKGMDPVVFYNQLVGLNCGHV